MIIILLAGLFLFAITLITSQLLSRAKSAMTRALVSVVSYITTFTVILFLNLTLVEVLAALVMSWVIAKVLVSVLSKKTPQTAFA